VNTSTPKIYTGKPALQTQLLAWMPVIIGLAVLYVPSLIDLFKGIWSTNEQMHGPIILGIALWLIHRKWPAMLAASAGQPTRARAARPTASRPTRAPLFACCLKHFL